MLIHDYKCNKCGKIFEKIVNTPDEKVYCCNTQAIKIFRNKMSFILKGDGWAKDGYTKKNKPWEKMMEY